MTAIIKVVSVIFRGIVTVNLLKKSVSHNFQLIVDLLLLAGDIADQLSQPAGNHYQKNLITGTKIYNY